MEPMLEHPGPSACPEHIRQRIRNNIQSDPCCEIQRARKIHAPILQDLATQIVALYLLPPVTGRKRLARNKDVTDLFDR